MTEDPPRNKGRNGKMREFRTLGDDLMRHPGVFLMIDYENTPFLTERPNRKSIRGSFSMQAAAGCHGLRGSRQGGGPRIDPVF